MRIEVQLKYYSGLASEWKQTLLVETNIKSFHIERSPKGDFTTIVVKNYEGLKKLYSCTMVEYINIIKEEQDEVHYTI